MEDGQEYQRNDKSGQVILQGDVASTPAPHFQSHGHRLEDDVVGHHQGGACKDLYGRVKEVFFKDPVNGIDEQKPVDANDERGAKELEPQRLVVLVLAEDQPGSHASQLYK